MKNLIGIVGLGYVGLPLINEISKKFQTIGFDKNKKRIDELNNSYDNTHEVSKINKKIKFTNILTELKNCKFIIVCVPTPIYRNKKPDLRNLKSACEDISKIISKGTIVVFESTVYPGCTQTFCRKILERKSKLKYNKDFFLGYSPERINPGKTNKKITDIIKITSGSNNYSARKIDNFYKKIIKAGTYLAPNMKTAEAAKIIENIQRDVNIALINELSMVFNKLNINTSEVIQAAATKWNFNSFYPGLVGGHCIGVDPYYFSFLAKKIGFNTKMILAGRKINDFIPNFIVEKTLKAASLRKIDIRKSKVLVLGSTFKEDCPDFRNSKTFDIMKLLVKKKINFIISDPYFSKNKIKNNLHKYFINFKDLHKNKFDIVLITVGHHIYKKMGFKKIKKLAKKKSIIFDVKSIFKSKDKSVLSL